MSRVNLGLHQPDVSVVWDLGPHDFSILRYWLEEAPLHVSAISRGCIIPDTPDVAFIDLEFASGTIAHVELSWLAPSKLRRTTIVGSREDGRLRRHEQRAGARLRLGRRAADPQSFGEYQLTYRTGDIVSPHVPAPSRCCSRWRTSARRSARGSRAPRQIGLEVVRMIEAVDDALLQAGTLTLVLSSIRNPLNASTEVTARWRRRTPQPGR